MEPPEPDNYSREILEVMKIDYTNMELAVTLAPDLLSKSCVRSSVGERGTQRSGAPAPAQQDLISIQAIFERSLPGFGACLDSGGMRIDRSKRTQHSPYRTAARRCARRAADWAVRPTY
jgi:hypothetical protein